MFYYPMYVCTAAHTVPCLSTCLCLQVVRTHFHDFMLDVHASLRRHEGTADPLVHVAEDIAAKTRVSGGRGQRAVWALRDWH